MTWKQDRTKAAKEERIAESVAKNKVFFPPNPAALNLDVLHIFKRGFELSQFPCFCCNEDSIEGGGRS